MADEKLMICEVLPEFDVEFDGDLCRVTKVLHICSSPAEAEWALSVFNPSRYGDWDTVVRIVPESQLDKRAFPLGE